MSDSSRETMLARVGTTLAEKYKLTRLLGAGGMGAVYEAVNSWTERRVAVKLMLGESARDEGMAARFLREARAASKLEHPNVVQILDMGRAADECLYIVQEYLQGSDLRHLLDEQRALSPKDALEIIVPVLSALVLAHRHGIVHRDLKPENIFLAQTASGTTVPKLIDFGIAKIAEGPEGNRLTKTGAAMGTPFYMSPEQASGDKTIDAQTDIWAMGIVLYETLTGRCPFEADNYNALIVQIAGTSPVPRIETFSPSIPKALADVIHRAIERDRTVRFRTMAQFLGALLDCQAFGDKDDWHKTLRSTHHASVDDAAATNRMGAPARVSAFDEGPGWADGAKRSTTLGQSAREIPSRPPSGGRRWYVGAAAILLVAVGATVGAVRGISNRPHASVAPVVTSAVPVTPVVPTAPIAPETFIARITAHPITAVIELDGEYTGESAVVRQFQSDGARHHLRITAPGYEPVAMEFVPAPSPLVFDLIPITRIGGHRTVAPQPIQAMPVPATEPTLVPAPMPASHPITPSPTPTPSPRTVNGAPVLGE